MKATKLSSLAVAVSMLTVAAPAVARADVITFTFEGLAEQGNLTSLVLSGGGLTATLTRPGGAFAVRDESGFQVIGFPASFGSRTVDPFENLSTAPFLLNFSQGITALSIQMGDFSGSDTDLLTIELFSGLNGTGTSLGFTSMSLTDLGDFNFLTPSVSTGAPALSARFFGGAAGGVNSVYFDNINVTFNTASTAVPEPGTLVLFASGIIGVGLIRRRKRG